MIVSQLTDTSPPEESPCFRLKLPAAPDSERGAVKVWSQPVEMLTYETAEPDPNPVFLEKRVYQGSSGRVYPLPVIDRVETIPVVRKWQAVHIENEFIRIMVLPEIGGRIHVGYDKRTGYDFIYRQNVIKPALVGLAGPWVSGGIEFNWPQHHRPATYMPVEVTIERSSDGSATIWCSDHDPMERMKGMHGIHLRPGRAVMELKVRLYNRTVDTRTFLWWANVATHANERYQSFFPKDVRFAADHAKRAITSYPLSNGTYYGIDYGSRPDGGVPERERPIHFVPDGSYPPNDLGWYANIPVPTSYMIANTAGDFSGGYDHKRDAGLVAVANHHIAPGKKQWTWGNHEFGYAWDRSLTDSDGPYVELMVGAYTDNQPDFSFLAPGETKTFSQYWYPISQIGVPDAANQEAALRVESRDESTVVHLQVTTDRQACLLQLFWKEQVIAEWCGDITTSSPLHHSLDVNVAEVDLVVVLRQGGDTLIRYAPGEVVAAEPPAVAQEPAVPEDITNVDELYLTGIHLEQYRHPTRPAEIYWREALRRDSNDSRCSHAMGRWHLRRGEFLEAERHLQTAIRRLQQLNLNPYDGEAFYNLGLTLKYLDQKSRAYDAFYKATWNAAWAGPAYHRLAEIDCQRHEWNSALDHLRRSLNKDSENLNARNLKAMVLRRLGNVDASQALLDETASLDPLDIFSRYLLHRNIPTDGQQCLDLCFDLLRAGFEEEALSILEAATESARSSMVDGSGTMLLYLATSVAKKLSLDTVSAYYVARAAAADTRYVFPHRLEELLLLQDTLKTNASDAQAHFYLGNLLYDKRRHLEAMEHWEAAAALETSIATVWRNLAIGYFNICHNMDSALRAFRKALALAPEDARLLFEFDQLQARTGVTPAARLEILQRQPELVAKRDDLSVAMASLLTSTKQTDAALALLQSRQFQPWEGGEGAALGQYIRAHLLAAVQKLRDDDSRQAILHLQQAQEPPATLAEAIHVLQNISALSYWMGMAFRRSGDDDAAKMHLELAANNRSDFQQMQVLEISEATFWSGLALRELGRAEEADALFHKILSYARTLEKQPPKVDFFATSLPTMLLFEEDIADRQRIKSSFLKAQAWIGLGRPEGFEALRKVLEENENHTGAIDLKRLIEE